MNKVGTYYERNKSKCIEKVREYRKKNKDKFQTKEFKEKISKQKKTYYERNKSKCIERVKEYRKKNSDKFKTKEFKEKLSEYNKKYYEEHKEELSRKRSERYSLNKIGPEFEKKLKTMGYEKITPQLLAQKGNKEIKKLIQEKKKIQKEKDKLQKELEELKKKEECNPPEKTHSNKKNKSNKVDKVDNVDKISIFFD